MARAKCPVIVIFCVAQYVLVRSFAKLLG